jgi:hypothetical protein
LACSRAMVLNNSGSSLPSALLSLKDIVTPGYRYKFDLHLT